MYKTARTINADNFPVFKKLIEEIILKSTGKPVLNNPTISEVVSKKINKKIKYMPESKAREIAIKLPSKKFGQDSGGRRLQTLINAALNDDMLINARESTLDILTEYVLRVEEDKASENSKRNELLNWKNYCEKYKNQLLQSDCDNISVQDETGTKLINDKTSLIQSEVATTTHELINKEQEITKTISHHSDFEKSQTNTDFIKNISTKKFIYSGIGGGICSGILASIMIAVVRYMNGENLSPFPTGYENINFNKFMKYIFASLLFFQMITGALLGWLCCYSASRKSKLLNNFLLFIVFFCVIVILRQSMARDAWYFLGTYPNYDEYGKIKMGGGLLGEPDFETIATGLMGAFVIFVLVHSLRKKKLSAFTAKDTFGLIIKTIVYGILAWCLVYCIYDLLTVRLEIIHKGDYLIAPSIFTVDFPHPERPIFSIAICMVYVLGIIFSIQYHFHDKKKGYFEDVSSWDNILHLH